MGNGEWGIRRDGVAADRRRSREVAVQSRDGEASMRVPANRSCGCLIPIDRRSRAIDAPTLGIASRTVASRAWVALRVVTLEPHTKDTKDTTISYSSGNLVNREGEGRPHTKDTKDTKVHSLNPNKPFVHLCDRGVKPSNADFGMRNGEWSSSFAATAKIRRSSSFAELRRRN
jgi:hypothetical protein